MYCSSVEQIKLNKNILWCRAMHINLLALKYRKTETDITLVYKFFNQSHKSHVNLKVKLKFMLRIQVHYLRLSSNRLNRCQYTMTRILLELELHVCV